VTNGLLLRAEIHTLFDLGLLAIDPDTLQVRLSSVSFARAMPTDSLRAKESSYLPTRRNGPTAKPSRGASKRRWHNLGRLAGGCRGAHLTWSGGHLPSDGCRAMGGWAFEGPDPAVGGLISCAEKAARDQREGLAEGWVR
jgi:hypothetical protein